MQLIKPTQKTNAYRIAGRLRQAILVRRSVGGSSIAELPPALFVLFMLLFFPLVDLAGMGVSWLTGCSINDCLTRQASMMTRSSITNGDLTSSAKTMLQGPLAKLARVKALETSVAFGYGELPGINRANVTVTTKITCAPLLMLPSPVAVPGLSAPISFTFAGSRLFESELDMGE